MGELMSIQWDIGQKSHVWFRKKIVVEVVQRSSCGGESTVYLRNYNV